MLLGGHGVISVTANVAPQADARAVRRGPAPATSPKARAAQQAPAAAAHSRLFVEANPIPVKWALAEMGLIQHALRLPLTPLSPQFHETVRAALRDAGCLVGLHVVEGLSLE